MPEIKVIETVFGLGGYDPDKPNNNIIEEVTAEISDEHLHQEALAAEFNDKSHQGLIAYNNWDSLDPPQKDVILKNLLGFILYKEGML